MDFWGIFMFFLLTFLIMSCCGYCCTTKRRGTVLSNNAIRLPFSMDWLAFLPLAVLILIASLVVATIYFIRCCFVAKMYVQLFRQAAPVVVTSATHTAPGGYTVTQIPATTYQPNAYGTPYPVQATGNVTVQMPMPGGQPPMPAMPPQMAAAGPYPHIMQPGAGAVNMNPPSYDAAMANPGPSVAPGTYEKQMPYNPNYAQ